MNLPARDKQTIWHPFTQHQNAPELLPMVRGEGAYLFDHNDRRYLDLISSWWVNLHGHAHPEIAQAIYQQAMTLEHVIFSGFTHEPAVQLAEELLKMLPSSISKIFYSDNGSTAVEIAIKMAYQYWHNRGEVKRKRFIAFEKSYHGDTFGAMSIGKKSGFFTPFEDLLFDVDMFAYPSVSMQDPLTAEKEQGVLQQIATYLERHGNEVAALIIEPLVQGAGGMNMCTPQFLQQLELLVRAHGVIIIYDEVMTGFGRTGELFACIKAKTNPDIICLAKGITGGFLPLAVTACHARIYEGFLDSTFAQALAHGHSFTANPLGCAAALASLEILQRPSTTAQIAMLAKVHSESLLNLTQLSDIKNPRYCGTIAAFDLNTNDRYGSGLSIGLRDQFLKLGLLIRPLGNVIYFLPPYCISEAELRGAYEVVLQEIQGVTA